MNLLNPLYCLSKETKCALKWLSRATNLENNRHNENKKHLQLSISGEVISVNNIHLYKAVRIRFQEGPGRSLAMAKWTLLLFKSVLEQHVLLQNCYEAARVFAQPFLCLSPGCITTRAVSLQMSFSLNTGFLDTSKRNRIKRLTPIPDHAPELLKDCTSLSCIIMLTILMILQTKHRISNVVIAYVHEDGRHSRVVNWTLAELASKLLSTPWPRETFKRWVKESHIGKLRRGSCGKRILGRLLYTRFEVSLAPVSISMAV